MAPTRPPDRRRRGRMGLLPRARGHHRPTHRTRPNRPRPDRAPRLDSACTLPIANGARLRTPDWLFARSASWRHVARGYARPRCRSQFRSVETQVGVVLEDLRGGRSSRVSGLSTARRSRLPFGGVGYCQTCSPGRRFGLMRDGQRLASCAAGTASGALGTTCAERSKLPTPCRFRVLRLRARTPAYGSRRGSFDG